MANLTFRNLFSLLQKRYLSTPFSTVSLPEITKDSNFALHFLTNLCGLPLKSAFSVTQKFQILEKNEKKLQSVIDCLKDEGFTHTQIAKLIQKYPAVLHGNVEATLKPKLEFLKQIGFAGEVLTKFLARNPSFFHRSLDSRVKPNLELLRHYLKSDDKILLATSSYSWLLFGRGRPNFDLLVKEGVPDSSIAKIIVSQPAALTQKHSKVVYVVNAVKNLGLQPNSPMFVHAFRVLVFLNESTFRKKMEFLQSFGWAREDILMAFKKFPYLMARSEGKIRKSVDFYLNTVKMDLQTILARPVLFNLAIDTRARPRLVIMNMLESRELIKEGRCRMTVSWITMSNKTFLEKYVIRYEDKVPGLLHMYSAGKSAETIVDLTT